jgi:CheY-like chemotaxis protein
MVDMTAFWMCKLAPTEIAGSDAFDRDEAFQRDELVCRKALTHDRARKVGHVRNSRRVLQVLVVDDEQDTTDGLVTLARRWGHAVRFAYDGTGALKVAAAQHPDVVLLDIEMPHMDGCRVARQLRRDFSRKECFIIAVTGDAGDERRRQCSEAGIDLVLVKPANPSVVETILMLECERVNRSRTDNASGVAAKLSSRFPTASGRKI